MEEGTGRSWGRVGDDDARKGLVPSGIVAE